MELGHLLTRSGLTYPEVFSKVYHDCFCQLGSSVSLLWVTYYKHSIYTDFLLKNYVGSFIQKETQVFNRGSRTNELNVILTRHILCCVLNKLTSYSVPYVTVAFGQATLHVVNSAPQCCAVSLHDFVCNVLFQCASYDCFILEYSLLKTVPQKINMAEVGRSEWP